MIVTIPCYPRKIAFSARAVFFVIMLFGAFLMPAAAAQLSDSGHVHHPGGEASLALPDLGQVEFRGINARTLLMVGLGISVLGVLFGLFMFTHLRKLPVCSSMREISELIYETCKTYLITQGKFILILEIFIGI
ncbi:MAG TPA: hypothetical protein VLL97_07175, partial [Acidobacteriota bacterium]|nr:hypothetical protein [Acidobacteriota bacterium]